MLSYEHRELIRGRVDEARRAGLGPVARPRRHSPVVRAAMKAERAQQALPLIQAIVVETAAPKVRCGFCGAAAADGVCPACDDLPALMAVGL